MANAYSGEKEAENLRQTAAEKEAMMQQMLQMQQQNSHCSFWAVVAISC